MRILLAGSTGVVGSRLGPLLTAAGHEVVALSRRAGGPDVLDRAALTAFVRDARPEVVMHQLTSLASGDRAANARLRRVGTRHLVDAALATGVRRVIAQSIAFAYAPGEQPATEGDALDIDAPEPRRTSVAGAAALEDAVRETPEWVVLRYGTLYGPGTWHARDGVTGDQARRGELTADQDVTSFLHADDAAAAAVQALLWPSGAVNICDDEPAPAAAWVPAFCAAIGAPAPAPPPALDERHGWARGASNVHARAALGWTPAHPTWRTGFKSL